MASELATLEVQLRLVREDENRALEAAHNAPLNPLRTDHDGHRWIEHQSSAWWQSGRAATDLYVKRRKLEARIDAIKRAMPSALATEDRADER